MSEENKDPAPRVIVVKKSELLDMMNDPANRQLISDKLHNTRTLEQDRLHAKAGARVVRQAAVQHRTVVGQQHDVMSAVFKTFENVYELLIDFMVSESIPREDMKEIIRRLREKSFIERHWLSIMGLVAFSVLFTTLGFSPNAASIGYQVLSNIYAQAVILVFSLLIVFLAFKSFTRKRRESPSVPY